ncbi:hypothetical protein [Anoxynatronum sibiricum]|uniref:Uncharacterized protein n=1 Tax=Anoxynatronum sibiricum TaxID=210623 RepID=A0ABU9VPU3_9CLOT
MNFEGFEQYLRQQGICTEHEIREVIARISWVETTLNISLDDLTKNEAELLAFRGTLLEIIGSEEKTEDFFRALRSYYDFHQGLS